jgi:signal transduction histidine kinase
MGIPLPKPQFLNKLLQTLQPQSTSEKDMVSEAQRKGRIFTAFIGVICLIIVADTLYQVYLAITYQTQEAQPYQQFYKFAINNLSFLVFLSLIWWGHRWLPNLMRHLFLISIVVGAIFFFEVEVLGRIFIAMTLPIIMSAFLITPLSSFLYFLLIALAYNLRLYQAGYSILDLEFSYTNFLALFILSVVSWLIAQSLEQSLTETRALNQELDQRVQKRTQELAEALDREQTLAIRNKTILESIADGIIVFDAEQKVLMANPAANMLARQNLQAVKQAQLLQTIDEETKATLDSWLHGSPPEDQPNVRFVWHNKTISANVAPVILPRDEDHRVEAGHVMVLRDFTREAQLEKAKDLFLGTVSHELRTPMSAIKGYVDLLLDMERDTMSPEGYEYLETVNLSISQLLSLANDLIDLSRLETGEVALYCQWRDLSGLIDDAVQIVQQEFSNRNLTLQLKVEPDLPALYLDDLRILQVLLNLLSNAYKYTPQGGATLTAYQHNGFIKLEVSDTGTGIKPEDQANLFQRFFRANDQVVQQAGGTGLGLSISKGLVELHRGQLTFESEYGLGSTFTITLPIEQNTEQSL